MANETSAPVLAEIQALAELRDRAAKSLRRARAEQRLHVAVTVIDTSLSEIKNIGATMEDAELVATALESLARLARTLSRG